MRAFAKGLNVSQSTLSRFLRGERTPSKNFLTKICARLEIPEHQIQELDAVSAKRSPTQNYRYLDHKEYEEIQHGDFVLIELLKLTRFYADPDELADKMEISREELFAIQNRLVKNGLLKIEGDFWVPAEPNTSFLSLGTTSIANHQQQMMELAIRSIQIGPTLGKRSHTGLVIAVSSSQWLKAVEKIDQFRKEMHELLVNSDGLDQVYQLAISLYPVTKKSKTQKL